MNIKVQKSNGEESTVRGRWTLLTMLVIFLTFSIFSYILMDTFERVMLDSEAGEVEDLTDELVERFSKHYYPLTEDSTANMLKEPEIELGPIPAPKYETERKESFSPPISLTKGGIVVKIYDINEKLIYETDNESYRFLASTQQKLTNIEGPYGTALSMIEPVYSVYNDNLLGYVQVIHSLKGFHEMTSEIKNFILIIGLAALLFSAIIGLLLVNSFVRPITSLTAAMESIQENLESNVRLDEGTRNNEFSKLASTYNEMVDLMQTNIKNQQEFVEDVSHELRTPVAVVEGHLKMLNRWGKKDPQILEESINASLQETKRMKSLVQEMLDLSRAHEIDVHYKNEITNVGDIMRQIISNYRMLYPEFIINLDEEVKDDLYVKMYRNHLEQVLVNILDNAIKYSFDRKEIHISIGVSDKQILIAIQDFGSGMSEEDLSKIFNRFYRVDKARSREKGGTGLGLPIVKELIEGYGGQVSVSSILDRGSVFNIQLPLVEIKA